MTYSPSENQKVEVYCRFRVLAAYLPVVIRHHTHFLFTCMRANRMNMGHQLHLNPRKSFLTSEQTPILEPVLKPVPPP